MFGFVIGALSLFGLIKVIKGGRHGYWGGHHGPRHFRWVLRGLFERLQTTPGQERVILQAVDEVREAAYKAGSDFRNFGPDVARAFRGTPLDHETLKTLFQKQDAQMDELRRTLLVALEKVHEALDEQQRRDLADLMERGVFAFGGWRRGFRGHHAHHRCGGRFSDGMNDARWA